METMRIPIYRTCVKKGDWFLSTMCHKSYYVPSAQKHPPPLPNSLRKLLNTFGSLNVSNKRYKEYRLNKIVPHPLLHGFRNK
jgi:hypothetical protein